ncbi:hypothetical protein N9Y42_09745, partial [Mariniblastus sp.]|nr:hypothetical protein [Mariniblastus sp.]
HAKYYFIIQLFCRANFEGIEKLKMIKGQNNEAVEMLGTGTISGEPMFHARLLIRFSRTISHKSS